MQGQLSDNIWIASLRFITPTDWLIITGVIVLAAAVLTATRAPVVRVGLVRMAERVVGLPVLRAEHDAMLRHNLGRVRGGAIGAGTAVLAIGFWMYYVGGGGPTLLCAATVSGWCLGAAIGVLGHGVTRGPEGPRFAHSRTVRVADLIPPVLVLAVRLFVLISCAGMAWEVDFSLRHPQAIAFPHESSAAVLLLIPALASWLLFEATSWMLVHRRRNAVSMSALAWDDALRASTLLDLAAGTLLATLVAAAFEVQETVIMRASLAYDESNGHTSLAFISPMYLELRSMFLLLAALLVTGLVSTVGMRRRFRRRLWFSSSPDGLPS